MNDTPKTEPPFTNYPRTEKVFPFRKESNGNWYRYQSEGVCLCEELERENSTLRAALSTALGIESIDDESLSELVVRCKSIINAARKHNP